MAAGKYRYVIVGAGSAGCVLANRLSADPACQVALLEAGGPDRKREIRIPAALTKLFLTEYDWKYYTTKQPHLSDRELYWPRGKTLGGSSSINAQAWTRGHRADYDGWAQSCPGWSYDEVLPYFQRAEHRVGSNAGGVYGTSGPQFISELRDPNPTTSAFLAACAELGLRPSRRAQRARQHRVFTNPGHPTPRAAAQHRGRLPAPRHATAQPHRHHRRPRPADSARRDPRHRRGVPRCGRSDPTNHRLQRGDPQRRRHQLTPAPHALRHRRRRPATRGRSAAAPRPRRCRCKLAGPLGRRRRRSLFAAGHPVRGRLAGPTGPVPARAPRDAHLQRERGGRLRPQRPGSARPRSGARLASGTAAGRGPDRAIRPRADLGGGAPATGQLRRHPPCQCRPGGPADHRPGLSHRRVGLTRS